jgi:hypothetical protein
MKPLGRISRLEVLRLPFGAALYGHEGCLLAIPPGDSAYAVQVCVDGQRAQRGCVRGGHSATAGRSMPMVASTSARRRCCCRSRPAVVPLVPLAVDGKVARGARDKDGKQVRLLAAMLHDQRLVLNQVAVGAKTNEIRRRSTAFSCRSTNTSASLATRLRSTAAGTMTRFLASAVTIDSTIEGSSQMLCGLCSGGGACRSRPESCFRAGQASPTPRHPPEQPSPRQITKCDWSTGRE